MINLFKITESYEVDIDKEWILLIPAFADILKADKGSVGDSEGRKKLKARKQLAYLYFVKDFRSPIYAYEEQKKHEEALRYVGLESKDVELEVVREGLREYEKLQYGQARSLRSLENALKGLKALDDYLGDVDFTLTDKQGKLLHSPKEYMGNISTLNKAYDELDKFEKRVHKELKENNATIRGMADLGDKEKMLKERTTTWEEGSDANIEIPQGSARFTDLTVHINALKSKGVVQDKEETEEE